MNNGFVCFFVCLSHLEILTGRFPESFMKILLDLAEIFMILKNRKIDWCDGGKKKGREGILLCNGLIV